MTSAELATRILVELGYSTAVSMEPGSDFRRDKITAMIDAHDKEVGAKALGEAANVVVKSPLRQGKNYATPNELRRMAAQIIEADR